MLIHVYIDNNSENYTLAYSGFIIKKSNIFLEAVLG